MDIPSPSAETTEQKVKVSVSSSAKATAPVEVSDEVKSVEQPSPNMKDDALTQEESTGKKVADAIASKKYFLPIKEKRAKPLLAPWSTKKKISKKKVVATKNSNKKVKASTESARAKKLKLLVVLGLWIGAYLIIDAGIIDIGWKPPFSVFPKKESAHSDVFTLPSSGAVK